MCIRLHKREMRGVDCSRLVFHCVKIILNASTALSHKVLYAEVFT